MRLAAFLLLLLPCASLADVPSPRVKAELSPKEQAWVGQKVTLVITLFTPDLFSGVPSFEIPPISGVIVVPPPGSPVVGSETIDGNSYTTQRHEFAVYAQRAGKITIPAFTIRFESNAGFGKPIVSRSVTTAAVSFGVKAPPGSEGLGIVIAARELSLKATWQPDTRSLKVGDAITQNITISARDIPGMVFPKFGVDDIDGLSAYPKDPVVEDRAERGTLTGQRVDSTTYICKREGQVTVPDRTFTWYDLEAKELKTIELPGRSFAVAPGHSTASSADAKAARESPQGGLKWWWKALILAALLTVGLLSLRLVLPRQRQRRTAWLDSEASYFARFRHACSLGDPHAVYVALLEWLDRSRFQSLDELIARDDKQTLSEIVTDLRNQVYIRPEPRGSVMWGRARELFAWVEIILNRSDKRNFPQGKGFSLPPLNPGG